MLQRRIFKNGRVGAWPVLRLKSGSTVRRAALASLFMMSVGMPHASSQIQSKRALHDVSSDTNPDSPFWRGVAGIIAERDANGDAVSGYRMEVRSRWTRKNLYFLFTCPYVDLNLNPDPKSDVETNGLWNWDVAEVFIGTNFQNIRRYKEFEISPQGEWVDLDIDLDRPKDPHDWKWNSSFEVAARIDPRTHTWYGFMKIPYSSVDSRPASAGNLLRVNFFLSEGAGASHEQVAWQSTHSQTFHVPEVFGKLKLVKR